MRAYSTLYTWRTIGHNQVPWPKSLTRRTGVVSSKVMSCVYRSQSRAASKSFWWSRRLTASWDCRVACTASAIFRIELLVCQSSHPSTLPWNDGVNVELLWSNLRWRASVGPVWGQNNGGAIFCSPIPRPSSPDGGPWNITHNKSKGWQYGCIIATRYKILMYLITLTGSFVYHL